MNKISRKKNKNFTTISNVFVRDNTLSLKAKGLLALIMALPDDWDFSVAGIIKIIKEGKDSVYNAINELKEHGFCSVTQQRNEAGVIVGYDYVFVDDPDSLTHPLTENPHTDNPLTGNPQQIKKEKTKELTKEKNTKKCESNQLFEDCWIAYKRKGKKSESLKYWNKLTEEEKRKVMPHIKAYISSRTMQYQRAFERYIRDKEFLDIVVKGNAVIYDPSKLDSSNTVYAPATDGALTWNDFYHTYIYMGYFDESTGFIPDGYTANNRPNGATIMLNNARGTIVWNSLTKTWDKK